MVDLAVEEQIWKICGPKYLENIKKMTTFLLEDFSLNPDLKIQLEKFLEMNEKTISSANKIRLKAAIATVQTQIYFMELLENPTTELKDMNFDKMFESLGESMKSPVLITFLIINQLYELFSYGNLIFVSSALFALEDICLAKVEKLLNAGYYSLDPSQRKDEITALTLHKMKICYEKQFLFQITFQISVSIHIDKQCVDPEDHVKFEKTRTDQLLAIAKSEGNTEFTSECFDLPKRVTNSEEAEKLARAITRNCSERLELYEKSDTLKAMDANQKKPSIMCNIFGFTPPPPYYAKDRILYDKQYYSGLIYVLVSKFYADESLKHKLMMKGLKNWNGFDVDSVNDPALKTMYLNYANENYQLVWQYKYKNYMKERDEKWLKNLKNFARNRVEAGKKFLRHIDTREDFPQRYFSDFRFDMMCCLRYVLDDEAGALRLAREIAELLKSDDFRAKIFSDAFNVPWEEGISTEKFTENILKTSELKFSKI